MRILALCCGLGAIVMATLALACSLPGTGTPGRPMGTEEMRRAVGACASPPGCEPLADPICGYTVTGLNWTPSPDCTTGHNVPCDHTTTLIYQCERSFVRTYACVSGGDGSCNPSAVTGDCGQKYVCSNFTAFCSHGTCIIEKVDQGCNEILGVHCASYQSCAPLTPEH